MGEPTAVRPAGADRATDGGAVTASAIYEGVTRHRRFGSSPHSFRMPLYMLLLDHAEMDRSDGPTRPGGPLGQERWWPAHYRRSDYLDGDESVPLGEAVRDLVEARTGRRPGGPVLTLTQVRTQGYVLNPITVHYCMAPGETGETGETGPTSTGDAGPRPVPEVPVPDVPVPDVMVLEVTNTPWKERHCYVIDARPGAATAATPGPVAVGVVDDRGRLHAEVPKALHVSPFMPMDQTYRVTSTGPGDHLWLRLETMETTGGTGGTADPDAAPVKVFEADLALRRRSLTRRGMVRQLVAHPFATYRVWAGIHAHAAILAARRVPFVPHPDRTRDRAQRRPATAGADS